MNYAALLNAIYHEPALILPQAHDSIRKLIEARFFDARAPGKDENRCGAEVEVEQPTVDENGIAHIPINGALGQGLDPFDRGSGAVDTLDIRNELATFAADEAVKGIVLDIDSPGGMVLGTQETSDAIMEAGKAKPIYSFSRGMIASAAYWLASSTHGIYVTPSANVGSIGTVFVFHDLSKMAADKGVKVDVISSGPFKGMGTPGTSLTDKQREHLQERVDHLAEQFKAHVVSMRGAIPEKMMQGQMHLAPAALKDGLVNGIFKDKASMVRAVFKL